MTDLREAIENLERGLEFILDARSDSRFIQGPIGEEAYAETDKLALLVKLGLQRLVTIEKQTYGSVEEDDCEPMDG